VDADKVSGLAGWFDTQGVKVQPPSEPDKEFLDTHRFLWNREALAAFLEANPAIYLCGISRNALDMCDLFDKVYFLKVPPEVLIQRLQHPNRDNPMGRTAYQLEYSLSWAEVNEAKARDLGIEMLDGTLPVEELLQRIVVSP
jgi:hypothetical protein